jgi:hypothetical protein
MGVTAEPETPAAAAMQETAQLRSLPAEAPRGGRRGLYLALGVAAAALCVGALVWVLVGRGPDAPAAAAGALQKAATPAALHDAGAARTGRDGARVTGLQRAVKRVESSASRRRRRRPRKPKRPERLEGTMDPFKRKR